MKEALVVYSLGNFLFAKYGVYLREFLYDHSPSDEKVKDYLERYKTAFNPTQFSYIVRITVSK